MANDANPIPRSDGRVRSKFPVMTYPEMQKNRSTPPHRKNIF
ncbi:hypothetical protein phiE131_027 [Burkholderia phage phiE131]|nr:hypothetical protein phiE131_027 [Burkholderia phage phiE131]AYJ74363.1 hypothetical protein phiE058_027 [Burkholderia phage phiE058]